VIGGGPVSDLPSTKKGDAVTFTVTGRYGSVGLVAKVR